MKYSAYKLNKHSDNIQSWGTPFPVWNQSFVPCPVLIVTSWFLNRQVRWSDIPISFRISQFVVIHTVKGFGIVNKAEEVDVFLELSWFFGDPMDAGNLISGSSAFSKSSLKIWKFTVHMLLKPGLDNFEHYFASVWDECNCEVLVYKLSSFLYDLLNIKLKVLSTSHVTASCLEYINAVLNNSTCDPKDLLSIFCVPVTRVNNKKITVLVQKVYRLLKELTVWKIN